MPPMKAGENCEEKFEQIVAWSVLNLIGFWHGGSVSARDTLIGG